MRKQKRRTFEQLILENKKQLMKDQAALDRIEEKIDTKREKELWGYSESNG